MSSPIEDHALVGDGETSALANRYGSVVRKPWCAIARHRPAQHLSTERLSIRQPISRSRQPKADGLLTANSSHSFYCLELDDQDADENPASAIVHKPLVALRALPKSC